MRNSVKAILTKLEQVLEQVEGFIDNANEANSPNEDRIEKLETERDALQECIDLLEGLE